jgi:hypothetical protein
VLRDFIISCLAVAAVAHLAAVALSSRQVQGNASPATLPTPTPADPAAVIFTTELGLVLHAVKPASVTDYEQAIVALQDALSKSDDPETQKVARGWRVYKAAELDAKSNPLYIHVLQPAVLGVDYRPSLWLDKLLAGAPPALLAKYRDSFAAPPSKLGLVDFANMSVAPVTKPANASPPKPRGITQIK